MVRQKENSFVWEGTVYGIPFPRCIYYYIKNAIILFHALQISSYLVLNVKPSNDYPILVAPLLSDALTFL